MKKRPIIEKTNKFNTLVITFLFPFTLYDQDIAKKAILPSLLVKTNNKYPDEGLFRRQLIDNLIIDIHCGFKTIGKERFLTFSLIVPDEKTIKKDILKDALQFFIDTIYDPNIERESFNQKYFNLKKEALETKIKNNLTNIEFYNDNRLLWLIDPNGESNRVIENNQEQLKDLNPINTYQFYKKIVLNKLPYIFAIGDIDKNKLESLLDELLFNLKPNNELEDIKNNFTAYLAKTKEQVELVEETGPYNQSCLTYAYKVKDMKPKDAPYLRVIDALLSLGPSDLLMKSLRYESGLVYYAGSRYYSKKGLLIIEARIGSQAKKIAMEKIEQTVLKLKDTKIVEPLLENIKEYMRLNLIKSKDSKNYFMDKLIYCETLKCNITLESQYQIIKDITVQQITDFTSRLELDTIYYLEGDKNES